MRRMKTTAPDCSRTRPWSHSLDALLHAQDTTTPTSGHLPRPRATRAGTAGAAATMSVRTGLSALRSARVEQVARLISGHRRGMVLNEESYRSARDYEGLT